MNSGHSRKPAIPSPLWVLVVFVTGIYGSLEAATFTVTRLDDPAPDGCLPIDCSLREAVIDANGNADADTIVLPAGNYVLTIPPSGGDDPESGSLDITAQLTVQGAGARDTVIDGSGLDRIFDVYVSALLVQIDSLTVRNGVRSTGGAGGILNRGALLTISSSTIADNSAPVDGGGLGLAGLNWLYNSTVSGNVAQGDGGGIKVFGKLTVVNSTVSTNEAGGGGGGIHSTSTASRVDLRSATIVDNTSDFDNDGIGDGGGLWSDDGSTVELSHTIVANNLDLSGEAPDCARSPISTLDSAGFNLIGNSTGCPIGGDPTGNLLDVPALIGPLADNGGPTDTHALLTASLAIDAGDAAGCNDEDDVPLTTDQRGYIRPTDGNGDASVVCDIGAFESPTMIFTDGFESGDTSAWSTSVP
ncbi:MAG: choice-of-anchor Q domain-containing protein [Acidobacteriota bacterium]